jgi:hypothetical protein
LEQLGDNEVTWSPVYRYEVLVVFDAKVGFEDGRHLLTTFGVDDGSVMVTNQPEGMTGMNGEEMDPSEEGERRFAELVQGFIEREGVDEREERRVFGSRFRFDQGFSGVGEEQWTGG